MMDKKFKLIREYCIANADPAVVNKYARYFTEGYDAYGLTREIYETERDRLLKLWELKWKESCGRTIVQYATEKMDKEHKAKFKKA